MILDHRRRSPFRGRPLALAVAVLAICALNGTPANADPGRSAAQAATPSEADNAQELLALMQRAGIDVQDTNDATELVQAAGVSAADAVDLLRSDERYADAFVAPVVTASVATYRSETTYQQAAGSDQQCGWATTRVSIKGGTTALRSAVVPLAHGLVLDSRRDRDRGNADQRPCHVWRYSLRHSAGIHVDLGSIN